MSDLDQKYLEDRALRDAAKANLLADIEYVKEAFSGKGLTSRFVDRIGDGARDVFEQASETAEDNRGIIAALVGAILLWLSRGPILELLGLTEEAPDSEDAIEAGEAETSDPAPAHPPTNPSGEDDD